MSIRKELKALDINRETMKNELVSITSELNAAGVDLDVPLTEDGYPRADIDVRQIAKLRGKYRTIQKDLVDMDKKIDELMPMAFDMS